MIYALLLLLLLVAPARAETARVLSGEHGAFTRLVIELPGAPEWTLGRTATGYAFSARGETQPDYDLTAVWQRITRARLAALAVDPASGVLSLDLGCDCHIFPFEYDTGIVVLDIKEGPAPESSAFEAAFSSQPAPANGTKPAPEYSWIAAIPPYRPVVAALPLRLDTGTVSLEPLRDELLEQIAKGAVDGLVDMELPGKPTEMPASDRAVLPWSNIRIGEQPGVTVTNPGALIADDIPPDSCAAIKIVDLAAWGEGRMPHDLLVEARSGLFGEFDLPDDATILRSARQLLYLGFGVEARQTLDMLSVGSADEAVALYQSMSRLVDGETDPTTPFAAMLECAGPAALWAALAHDRLPAGPGVNRDAILQAFMALPAHLRRHLGTALAEKFLARDDSEAVRMIRDAMERSPEVDEGSVALLDAKASLHEGDTEAARSHAEAAVALDGNRAGSLVTLVEAHFRKLQPIDPGIADALLALRGEAGGDDLLEIDRAIVLALALSNRTNAAFEAGPTSLDLSDLWQVVQARSSDDDFLRHAVLPSEASRPEVADEVARATADRLLNLGFADAALVWLGPVDAAAPPELWLPAARMQFKRGDARAALALLEGVAGTEADEVRAQALLQLGDLPGARAALADAGESEAATRVELWAGNWADLSPQAADPWRAAADLAQARPASEASGLLDRGNRTVKASLAARDAIKALLAGVPSPGEN